MGNYQGNESRSLCDFDFFTPADLRRSSLQRHQIRRPPAKSHTCIEQKRQSSSSSNSSVEKEENSPDVFQRNPLSKRAHTCIILKDKEKTCVSENDFRIMQIIADGKYGRICMVKRDDKDEKYAMKIYGKRKITHQCWTENVMIEKEILEKSHHPFLPELVYSFENNKKIFLVTKFYEGGELHKMLQQLTRFSEEITRFYSAEVLLTLEYLHENVGVIYNDLKAENIVLDSEGHIRLIDFDMATRLSCSRSLPGSRTMLDSPPPEVINGTLTGRMVDYWGFGCFIYELLTGKKPFHQGHDIPQEVDRNVLENNLEWPQFISKTAKDLITRLLNPKVEERLGYNGIDEIKKHPFFSNIKWDKIITKTVYPPLNPSQYKEHTSMPEEEDALSESEDMDYCSLTHIPESGTIKAETSCLMSAGLPHRKNLVNTSGGSYDGLARSS